MDILPEEVALKYGYRADQRVVNVVLRPRFRAATAEAEGGVPTAGGRVDTDVDLEALRIDGDGRLSPRGRARALHRAAGKRARPDHRRDARPAPLHHPAARDRDPVAERHLQPPGLRQGLRHAERRLRPDRSATACSAWRPDGRVARPRVRRRDRPPRPRLQRRHRPGLALVAHRQLRPRRHRVPHRQRDRRARPRPHPHRRRHRQRRGRGQRRPVQPARRRGLHHLHGRRRHRPLQSEALRNGIETFTDLQRDTADRPRQPRRAHRAPRPLRPRLAGRRLHQLQRRGRPAVGLRRAGRPQLGRQLVAHRPARPDRLGHRRAGPAHASTSSATRSRRPPTSRCSTSPPARPSRSPRSTAATPTSPPTTAACSSSARPSSPTSDLTFSANWIRHLHRRPDRRLPHPDARDRGRLPRPLPARRLGNPGAHRRPAAELPALREPADPLGLQPVQAHRARRRAARRLRAGEARAARGPKAQARRPEGGPPPGGRRSAADPAARAAASAASAAVAGARAGCSSPPTTPGSIEDRILIRDGVPELDLLNGSAVGGRGGQPEHELELQAGVFKNGLGAPRSTPVAERHLRRAATRSPAPPPATWSSPTWPR